MTTQQNNQDNTEYRLKKALEENELLLVQLHQLEEELEQYFVKNQELEKGKLTETGGGVARFVWVDDEHPDALAEIQRLHAQIAVLRKVHQLESENSLNVKLGDVLVQGVDSPGNFIALPRKVTKIWWESSRKTPPKTLGGQGFEKVMAVYSDGGFTAVEKLFSRVTPSPATQANGYTALARHVMKSDRSAAAEAARRAYETDPKPFRLKWLAFRLHEAGDVIEAEAILDTLPKDITFSESESRHADRLRNEAKHVRLHEAKQTTGFLERRAEVERQLAQIEELKKAKEQEEEENELLQHQLFQTQGEFESLNNEHQRVQQAKEQLEQEKIELTRQIEEPKLEKEQEEKENELLLEQLFHAQEEFEKQYVKCQTIEWTQTRLEQEKADLVGQKEEQVKLATERQMQLEQLTRDKVRIEEYLGCEIETLKQTLVKLEKEKQALSYQKEEQVGLVTEREAKQLDQQTKTAEQRLQQINALENNMKDEQHRITLLEEKLTRAEAQIELIKDLFLREQGL